MKKGIIVAAVAALLAATTAAVPADARWYGDWGGWNGGGWGRSLGWGLGCFLCAMIALPQSYWVRQLPGSYFTCRRQMVSVFPTYT